jgi:type II secretory pathway predicted ATPase ExeA
VSGAGAAATLVGRAAECERLRANLAARRHTLLVGPLGAGKSHLLRGLAAETAGALALEQIRPLRAALVELCRLCHARGWLPPDPAAPAARDWAARSRLLGRLGVHELTAAAAASLRGRGAVLVLDQLEQATPSMLPALDRLLAEATLVGATRVCRAGLEKLWWGCDRLDLPPLAREPARALLWARVDRARVEDPALLEATVLDQAAGNPHAIVEMARQLDGVPRVDRDAIRALGHAAGVRHLDLTPALLLVAAGLVATRFVALGLDDRDLYILAGSLGALFFVVRYFLTRRSL